MNSTTPSTNNMTPQQQQQPQPQSNQPNQSNQQQQDPYLTNDYYPLQLGNKAIIAALRADEVSSHADLYKVISASTSSSSTYHVVNQDGKSTGGATGAGADRNAAAMNGNGNINGHGNGHNHHNHQMNGTSNHNPSSFLPHPILKYTNSIPIPQSMRQKIEQETKMSSLMGILPQGNMIWISVDDRLFLWEYGRELEGGAFESGISSVGGGGVRGNGGSNSSSGDFVCFRVPSGQCVVSVGLVKPKKGVFKDVVEWCLVVTTHEEVIICALTRQSMVPQQQHSFGITSPTPSSPFSQLSTTDTYLNLIPTRYLIPTDSIPMLSICGTDDGRIFMGGYDGCLYEMSYEGYVSSSSSSSNKSMSHRGGWYEEDDISDDDYQNSSVVNTLASGSKRALSTLLFGPSIPSNSSSSSQNNENSQRPRKCRKVNHTSIAPKIVSAFVPGFVMNAASYVLGSNTTSSCGPIVKLTLDSDRKTMYALTSKGFVHAFDLDSDVSTNGSSNASGSSCSSTSTNSPPKLACTVNISKSVQRYLNCVQLGKMYAPSMGSGADGTIADIHFAGGGAAAQAGVGGMEGARSILKIYDSEMMKRKQKQQATSTASGNGIGGMNKNVNASRRLGVSDGCLHPVSIDVVPPTESKHLTLVVISTAGLRYHLSVLPDGGTNRYGNTSTRPGRRFTLCHVRAPPPLSITSNDEITFESGGNGGFGTTTSTLNASGIPPSLQSRGGVLTFETKNACYKNGTTLLAMDCSKSVTADSKGSIGDSILVMTPDYTSQDGKGGQSGNASNQLSYVDTASSMDGKGLSEIVSQPMRSSDSPSSSLDATIMAGGHMWDIKVNTNNLLDHGSRSIMNLYEKSTTPPDSILDSDIVPPYIPSVSSGRGKVIGATKGSSLQYTSYDAAKSMQEKKAVKSKEIVDNKGIAYTALSMLGASLFSNLFSKPMPIVKSGKMPMYQVVHTKACYSGFSNSSLEKSKYGRRLSGASSSQQSTRLHASILKPTTTPLPDLSTEHIVSKSRRQGVIALNSGGLHYFTQEYPIDILRRILLETNFSNIGRNEKVLSFFEKYNRVESIALCLSIALDEHSSDQLSRTAIQAVMRNSTQPRMILSQNNSNATNSIVTEMPTGNDVTGIEGFTFKPSALHDGLLAITSRLLRPIWCKPAIVVTEGKIAKSKRRNQRPRMRPAKVEILLDEIALDRIKKPLARLLILMKEFFHRAVNVVPGSKPKLENAMETDEMERSIVDDSTLMTSAIQFQTQGTTTKRDNKASQPSDRELSSIAQLNEEREIHSLYRIVSRSVQLLTLVTQLQRAQENQDLSEVDFGYLHGLTYSQLVTSKTAQDRIDTVLTNMFTNESSVQSAMNNPSSVELNRLSSFLSRECPLYFSIGSRLTQLGFSTALSAMSQQPATRQRDQLTKSASSYLRQASKHWYNPVLVSGQPHISKTPSNSDDYEILALRAHESGSPLSRAAFALMELSDVVGVVAVCLTCASNFGGIKYDADTSPTDMENSTGTMMPWERGLYHRPISNTTLLDAGNLIQSADSEKDKTDTAKHTCYAVLFNCLACLLKSTYEYQQNINLAEEMLAYATSSKDINFLKELYMYLDSSGNVETLLRIESPSVESWLENIKKDTDLLWRYYVIHRKYYLAGELMRKQGVMKEKVLTLEKRIECLNRAANSYSNALSDSPSDTLETGVPTIDEIKLIMKKIRDQVDVAELQIRVLSSIKSSKYASQMDKDKMDTLSMSLVDATVLYNEYAAPLSFYDLCLAIIQSCGVDDSATIVTLWRSIICEEILPCQTNNQDVQRFLNLLKRGSMLEEEEVILSESNVTNVDGESLQKFEDGGWVPSIRNRIISLGKELLGKGADFVFPIDFVTQQLEGLYAMHKSVSNSPVGPWTLKTMVEAGAPYPKMLEAYNLLEVAQQPDSTNPITKVSQLSCISRVLKQWLSTASAFGDNGDNYNMLKRYATTLIQQVDSYKSTLESMTGWDREEIATIHASFSEIEEALRRLDRL